MRIKRHLQLTFTAGGLLLAVVGVVVSPAPRVQAFDHVTNGDFENGTDAWSASPNLDFNVTPASDLVASENGSVAALTLGASAFMLRQTSINGTVSGTYAFSARVRMTSSSTIVFAQVSSNPSAAAFRFDAPQVSDEWMVIGGGVDVTGFTNVVFAIGGSGSSGDVVYVDDIRFEGAPPATMTPTHTPLPPTATFTPLPGTATKTPRPTHTPKPDPTEPIPTEPLSPQSLGSGTALNGGFEDTDDGGLPVAWDSYGGSLSIATSPVRTGGRAARLESTTDSTKWLFQTITVNGGKVYAFDAWILHDDPRVASAFLRVSWYVSEDGSGTALGTADSLVHLDAPSTEWRYLTTGGIAAPAEAHSAKARVLLQPISTARAAIYVDDASFGASSLVVTADAASTGTTEEIAANVVSGTSRRPTSDRVGDEPSRTLPPSTGARVLISEVLYDSVADGEDARGEWVELHNPGPLPVSLEGWTLADAVAADVLDALTIPAGGFAIIAASPDFSTEHPTFAGPLATLDGRIGNGLGNDGDILVLVEPSGRFADAISWGKNTDALDPPIADAPAGHSLERMQPGADRDRADDFIDSISPSPGRAYDMTANDSTISPNTSRKVQLLSGEGGFSFDWLPWLLAAASTALLAGVASWRALPSLTGRLRHQ